MNLFFMKHCVFFANLLLKAACLSTYLFLGLHFNCLACLLPVLYSSSSNISSGLKSSELWHDGLILNIYCIAFLTDSCMLAYFNFCDVRTTTDSFYVKSVEYCSLTAAL